MVNNLKVIIGLEVHVELSTKSKMFCGCSAYHFGVEPNSNICPTCLGLPGALPYANGEAILSCVKLGLALNCNISTFSKFDRKHYSYPDLPKGFQTTQYDLPFCLGGSWKQNGSSVNIRRIHMEEDTAKMIHKTVNGVPSSLVDFNRSGVPLVELVTEPDFHDAASVEMFLKSLQKTVRYLEISDADMEKGSMRLEANISLSQSLDELPDYKVELKNINSFRFLRLAIESEIRRQSEILGKGERVVQETRGFKESTGETFSQRVKEEAHDYRYFPEPDLPPIILSAETIAKLKNSLPELPDQKVARYIDKFGLKESYATILSEDKVRSVFFEEAVKLGEKLKITPTDLASLMVNQQLDKKTQSSAEFVKKVHDLMFTDYTSGEELSNAVGQVINENEDVVVSFRSGKEQVLGFLIGMVQKKLGGKGNPAAIRDHLLDSLRKK